MNKLVETLRLNRYAEIDKFEKKSYVMNKQNYRFSDFIEVEAFDKIYKFNVQTTYPEILFYITQNGSNMYFSISEIYDLLLIIKNSDNNLLLQDVLSSLLVEKNQVEIFYDGNIYHARTIKEDLSENYIIVEDDNMIIGYNELFFLIILIQEKSNYLFSKSKEGMHYYKDGIIRLLIVLLSVNNGNPLLEDLGWMFNEETNRFNKINVPKSNKRQSLKYYLTQAEFEDIMD